MHFKEPYELTLQVGGRRRIVILHEDLLSTWWGADWGPQDAAGIARDNMRTIHRMVTDKLADGWIDPQSEAPIKLTSLDWED